MSDRGSAAPVLLVALALVGLTCMAIADAANVLVVRQRTVAAADAAALAAAVAQWPATAGADAPDEAARAVAEANGATLVRCVCPERGARATVVVEMRTTVRMLTVAPRVVRARAEARIDRARLFRP